MKLKTLTVMLAAATLAAAFAADAIRPRPYDWRKPQSVSRSARARRAAWDMACVQM